MFLKIGEHYYNRNHIHSVSVIKEDEYTTITIKTPDGVDVFQTTLSVPEVHSRLIKHLGAAEIVDGSYFEALFEATEMLKKKAENPVGISGQAVVTIEPNATYEDIDDNDA